jgi:hypothetical protein
MSITLKRVLKEPLLHFLVLGAGLFVAYGMVQKPDSGPDEIVVTSGDIEHLAAGFTRVWQRPPTPQEMADLVKDRVREEVYCREALALGLDRNDTVIRRRLRQKMEFIADDIAAQAEPADAELTAYLQAHPEPFRIEPRFTFHQVFLNPENHGEHLARDAGRLLETLIQAGDNADAHKLGDPSFLQNDFVALASSEVARLLGTGFADKLSALSPGQWHGPIESAYGMHLVLISERTAPRLPELAEVREAVRREWDNARRLRSNEEYYQNLLQRYTVTVEGLESVDQESLLAANQQQ